MDYLYGEEENNFGIADRSGGISPLLIHLRFSELPTGSILFD